MQGMSLSEWEREEEGSSVVVHVSLKSCVGRSAPSRAIVKKGRTKDSPCEGSVTRVMRSWALITAKGMLLIFTMWRRTRGISIILASIQLVARKRLSGREPSPVFTFLVLFSRFYDCFYFFIFLFFPGESPQLKGFNLWRHRCCRRLFVEEVAVDTDGREAAPEPETRANELPAAECCYWEYVAEPCWAIIHATSSLKATSTKRESMISTWMALSALHDSSQCLSRR